MLTAIIVAAGSSVRAGFDKLFAPLNGEPVVTHTIAAFEDCADVAEIIIVGRADHLAELRGLTSARFPKVTRVIAGGTRRQDSVAAGLAQLGSEAIFVAIHDAARPLVTPEFISRIFASALANGASAAATPVVDTLKRATGNLVVCGAVDRELLFAMQTPQIFERRLIERAYAAIARDDVTITDEVSAIESVSEKVTLVPNNDFNFKITYASDLQLAEAVICSRRAATTR